MTTANQTAKNDLKKIIDRFSTELLKGVLPKTLMLRLTNMGIPTSKAKMIVDLSCREANQFSHYKIGGKYCKENKFQNY